MHCVFSLHKARLVGGIVGIFTGLTVFALISVGGCVSTGRSGLAASTHGQPALHRAFWAWCWSAPATRDKNLYPMIWVRHADYANPAKIAAETRDLPQGKVALFFWNGAASLLSSRVDTCRTSAGKPTAYPGPWLCRGAVKLARQFTQFFQQYKAVGGRLNYLVLDYEAGITCWQISPAAAHAIETDPRFAGLAERLGFSNMQLIFRAGVERRMWNLLAGRRVAQALNLAFYRPAQAIFPQVQASNFGGDALLGMRIAPDVNGHYQLEDCIFGSAQSPAFYGTVGGLAHEKKGGRLYGQSSFAALRYEILYLEAIMRSSAKPVVPWIGYWECAHTPRAADYYRELVYQLALHGVNEFLYWNPRAWLKGQKYMSTARDDTLLNHYLSVLNQKLGPTPGQSVHTAVVCWNSTLLVAGRKTSTGQILYRVTVPPGTRAIIAEPIGRRISTGGKCGVWVSSPQDQLLTFRVSH